MHEPAVLAPPEVDARMAVLRVPDPGGRLAGVRLVVDRVLEPYGTEFARNGEGWRLDVVRPGVRRIEYRLGLRHADGTEEETLDPANPERSPGAFGERSVVRFPGYAEPAWLAGPAPEGESRALEVRARGLGARVPVRIWSPAGAQPGDPLPLLLVHDGPEYDALASLARYAAAMIAGDRLPPFRLALLSVPAREEWYSASARYARALSESVLPALRAEVAVAGPVAGLGASLGGLAMLHAQRTRPGCLGALALQSGSFFHPRHDRQEAGFARFGRIARFVRTVLRGDPAEPVPAVLTCGSLEENLLNNRLVARALADQGYEAALHEVADLHNHTAWRDALHPHVTGLLARVWG